MPKKYPDTDGSRLMSDEDWYALVDYLEALHPRDFDAAVLAVQHCRALGPELVTTQKIAQSRLN